MKRELAFALQTQSNFTASLGRTRASKFQIQSGDLNSVSQDKGRKRRRGSDVNESELNGAVDGSEEKSDVIGVLDGNQERKVPSSQCNGIAVYSRNRSFKDASPEVEKVSVVENLVHLVEDIAKCNFVTPLCENESKGELDEAPGNEDQTNGCENTIINEGGREGASMAVVEPNEARNGESIEVNNDGVNEARTHVPIEVPQTVTQSVLSSASNVELVERSASVAAGSGLMVNGENKATIDVDVSGNSNTPTGKLELKMSKKIASGRRPKTVKELLATGLLEGYSVFYNGGNKGFKLRGRIKDDGILCSCSLCMGTKVVNPCHFEIHACNSYRRAAQYICFENGKSLLEVVKICRNSPLDSLEEMIRSVIGSLPGKEMFICKYCKGSFLATVSGSMKQLCELCLSSKISEAFSTEVNDSNAESSEPVLVLRKSPRTAKAIILSEDKSPGRTREDRSLKPTLAPKSLGSASVCDLSQNKSQVRMTRNSSRSASVSRSSTSALALISSKNNSQRKAAKRFSKSILAGKSHGIAAVHKLSQNKNRRKLMKRSSKASSLISRSSCVSLQKKSKWKITRKDLRLHKLVFEEGGLPEGTEVAYYSCGRKFLEGYKRGTGIFCRCCNSEVSASQFEAHAGWASRRKPYNYIYTSNGVSLHEFAVSLLKDRKCRSKDNDDLCIICADGGNLLLCDGCPRAFHIECASLSSVPRGKWFCNYCQNMFQREKFVEYNANAIAAGRVSGVDLIEQITKRCIRLVKNQEEAEVIACVLCRGHDFSKSGFCQRTVIVCDQCEKEYHVGCLKKYEMADLKELPKGKWFCCMDCGRIYSALQNWLNREEERIPDSLLDVIKKKLEDKVFDTVPHFDVRWMLLNGKMASPRTRPLLSKAVAIFHDCFDPIVDSATGRDFIPSMVYGRNIRGQDFEGMYCAVLTVNSTIVSAGIFRVFGQEIAELPLVATSNSNQGKGYFQILFSCIEKLLSFLNVKNLVLPAADEAESIWTNKFGFEKIPPEQLSDYRKSFWQMLTFEGTSMLQKKVPQCAAIQHNVDGVAKEFR